MDKHLPIHSSHSAIPIQHTQIPLTSIPLTISFALDTQLLVPQSPEVIRCCKCKCYLNPYVEIIPPGHQWRCNLCYQINQIPRPYNRIKDIQSVNNCFSPSINIINNTAYDSIELTNPIYEVPASPNYILKSPSTPVILFLIEYTEQSVTNHSVSTILDRITQSLLNISDKFRYSIVFVNEFCHVLTKKNELVVVSDTKNVPSMFMDDFLFYNDQSFDMGVADMVCPGRTVDVYGGMMLASVMLKLTGGTVFTFITSVPFGGHEKCGYSDMAIKMSHYAICVNLLLFPTVNVNLKDFDILACNTGGSIYYYPNYNGNDRYFVNRFAKDFNTIMERGFFTDAICKIRGSEGVKIQEYCGSFMKKANDVLAFSNFNPSHVVTIKYALSNLKAEVCFQAAILRTVKNKRMIRVTNFVIPFDETNNLFGCVNVNAVVNHLSASIMLDIDKGRARINTFITNVINGYKKSKINMQHNTDNALLPPNLEALPLLCLALSKVLPLRPSSLTPTDYRRYYIHLFTNYHSSFVDHLIHPVMLPLHAFMHDEFIVTSEIYNYACILSKDSLENGGLYLLDTGVNIFIYDMGCNIINDIIHNAETGRVVLENYDNAYSEKLIKIINILEDVKPVACNMFYVRDGGKSVFRDIFMSYLVCDENNGMPGYNEYVKQISK